MWFSQIKYSVKLIINLSVMLVAFLQLEAASSQPTIDVGYPESRDKYHSMQYVSKLENLEESQRTMLTKLANQTEKLDMIINRLNDVSTCEQKSAQSVLKGGCGGMATRVDRSAYPSGVYSVLLAVSDIPVSVFCDMTTDKGGWTVFQRRKDGSVNFQRTWNEYKNGFGYKDGEFWLGNEHIHALTRLQPMRLRIDLTDWAGASYYAEYSHFVIGESGLKYKLVSVGVFSGDAGNSLTSHIGLPFSTFDQDNDNHNGSCSQTFRGTWWYAQCHVSNLNGEYKIGGNHSSFADGIAWNALRGYHYSFKTVEMKVRPEDFRLG